MSDKKCSIFVKFNPEFISVEDIKWIASAAQGIVLSHFIYFLAMRTIIEFLWKDGSGRLRMQGEIRQTVSAVVGIVIGWLFILAYLCFLENFGVFCFVFHKNDMKDVFISALLWKMNKRPEAIPYNVPIR